MSIKNIRNSILSTWEVDEDGNKISIKTTNEKHQIVGSKVVLNGIPDEQYRVDIEDMFEISYNEEIETINEYKVDYRHTGTIFFHPDNEGRMINVKSYYSMGVVHYPASRVWTKANDLGEVEETLEGMVDNVTHIEDTVNNLDDSIEQAKGLTDTIDNKVEQSKEDVETLKEAVEKSKVQVEVSKENINSLDETIEKSEQALKDLDKGISGAGLKNINKRVDKVEETKADKSYVDKQLEDAGRVKSVNGQTGVVVLDSHKIPVNNGSKETIGQRLHMQEVNNAYYDKKLDASDLPKDLNAFRVSEFWNEPAGEVVERLQNEKADKKEVEKIKNGLVNFKIVERNLPPLDTVEDNDIIILF